jgi:hypothetical protein
VLLVDDHQPEPLDGCEHRGARADAHARLAYAQPPPLVVALAGRQSRVQNRHRVAEALHEAADHLRREHDLRHKHDRAAALLERDRRRTQVELGLPRAGYPMEQQPLRAPASQGAEQRRERIALLAGQRQRLAGARADRELGRAARHVARLESQQAMGGEPSQRRMATLERARNARPPRERAEDPLLQGGE